VALIIQAVLPLSITPNPRPLTAQPVRRATLSGPDSADKWKYALVHRIARDSMALLEILRRGNAHANWHRAP
jgi:hypothetical protein